MSDPYQRPRFTREELFERRQRRRKLPPNNMKSAAKLASLAAAEYAKQQAGERDLSEESIKRFLMLSPAELNVLSMITSGNPPRNAIAILAGIRLKLEYTLKKPESAAANAVQPVTVVINSLAATPVVTTTSDAPPAAVAPEPSAEGVKETS